MISIPSGKVLSIDRASGAVLDACWSAIETGVSPVNGGVPVSSSKSKQPVE